MARSGPEPAIAGSATVQQVDADRHHHYPQAAEQRNLFSQEQAGHRQKQHRRQPEEGDGEAEGRKANGPQIKQPGSDLQGKQGGKRQPEGAVERRDFDSGQNQEHEGGGVEKADPDIGKIRDDPAEALGKGIACRHGEGRGEGEGKPEHRGDQANRSVVVLRDPGCFSSLFRAGKLDARRTPLYYPAAARRLSRRAAHRVFIFYMVALLYPENHRQGEPNDLERFSAGLEGEDRGRGVG